MNIMRSTKTGGSLIQVDAAPDDWSQLKCHHCDQWRTNLNHLVYYCSKDCQRQDWGDHKAICKSTRQQQGKPSEDDLKDKVPRKTGPCELCKKTGCKLQCAKCEEAYYCSKECQREDWKNHKATKCKDKVPRKTGPCELCKKTGCKLQCAKCEEAYYCSKECQREDWKNHKATKCKDRNDEVTRVEFYLDYNNPFPFFSYSQVKPGNYICLLNPLIHHFRDGTIGIRVDDPSEVTIIDGHAVK